MSSFIRSPFGAVTCVDWTRVLFETPLAAAVNTSFDNSPVDVNALHEAAIRVFKSTPRCAACLFLDGDDPLLNAWNSLPPVVASLVRSPSSHVRMLVFNVDVAREIATFFEDVSDPLWCWLYQAVRCGRHLGIVPIDVGVSSVDDRDYPSLAPRTAPAHDGWLLRALHDFQVRSVCGAETSQEDAVAARAGLFQLHDCLDQSHELSQSVENRGRHRAGDYWHAINHRREPDDANSKYWFRQVGQHPIFSELALRAHDVLSRSHSPAAEMWIKRLGIPEKWDPYAFVDLCSACRCGEALELESAVRLIQFHEMLLLMDQTLRDAVT